MCNEPEFLQERLSEIIADVSTNESFDEEDFEKIIQKFSLMNFTTLKLYIKNLKCKSSYIRTGWKKVLYILSRYENYNKIFAHYSKHVFLFIY